MFGWWRACIWIDYIPYVLCASGVLLGGGFRLEYLALHGGGKCLLWSLSTLLTEAGSHWIWNLLICSVSLASLPQGPARPGALTPWVPGYMCTAPPCEWWGPRWWSSFLHGEYLIYWASSQPSQCFFSSLFKRNYNYLSGGRWYVPWHVKNIQKSVLFSHVVPEALSQVALLGSQRLCPQSYPFGPQTTLGEPPL